jgi:hypothetical protein
MSKTKDLTTTTSTEVAAYTESDMAEWGSNEMSSKDIVIPALILMQSNSEAVKANKGRGGDFLDSVSGKNYGSVIENVVPFHMEKSWTVEKFNGKKWEWETTVPMTLENEALPYEFEQGGEKFRRKYTYRFYLLVEGNVLPYSLKLKGASKKAGSNLATEMFVKNKMKSLPPSAIMFNISSELEKNDEGDSYFVVKITPAAKTPYDKVLESLNWFKTIRKSDTVVVDEDKEF